MEKTIQRFFWGYCAILGLTTGLSLDNAGQLLVWLVGSSLLVLVMAAVGYMMESIFEDLRLGALVWRDKKKEKK